jgi:Caspase domain
MVHEPDRAWSDALLIGTSVYDDPTLPDLLPVANNLADLQHVLTDPSTGAFHPRRCHVIADAENVSQVGSRLGQLAKEAGDVLLVYFSGHGMVDESDNELYLAVSGSTRRDCRFNAIPYAWIRKELARSSARLRVVILDCCFSGRAAGAMSADQDVAAQIGIEGSYVLASTPANTQALCLPGAANSAFTGELLTLMRRPTPPGQEPATLEQMYQELVVLMRDQGLPTPQRRVQNDAAQLTLIRSHQTRPKATAPVAAVPMAVIAPAAAAATEMSRPRRGRSATFIPRTSFIESEGWMRCFLAVAAGAVLGMPIHAFSNSPAVYLAVAEAIALLCALAMVWHLSPSPPERRLTLDYEAVEYGTDGATTRVAWRDIRRVSIVSETLISRLGAATHEVLALWLFPAAQVPDGLEDYWSARHNAYILCTVGPLQAQDVSLKEALRRYARHAWDSVSEMTEHTMYSTGAAGISSSWPTAADTRPVNLPPASEQE